MDELKPWGVEKRTFLMLMHLSQFLGYVAPGAGFLAPIIMWATTRDSSEEIDQHGKVIMNWMFSYIIYSIASTILVLLLIGFVGLFALMLVNVIFVVLGAVKANDGVLWRYPMSINFFELNQEDGSN
jgi:uncharacterized Tic20 family protein